MVKLQKKPDDEASLDKLCGSVVLNVFVVVTASIWLTVVVVVVVFQDDLLRFVVLLHQRDFFLQLLDATFLFLHHIFERFHFRQQLLDFFTIYI